MEIIDTGHEYKLKDNGKTTHSTILRFYKDKKINGVGYAGTTNQEVIRALIDRVKFLNNQKQDKVNTEILYHLRMVLALHETRHIIRCVEEGYDIENVKIKGNNDHFIPNKNIWDL